ncbi:MAG: sigma 54-interacting transcriptional regulator [Bacillota bacterium]|jgi:transcriptional regulator with PAS, ATPase and Fis domain
MADIVMIAPYREMADMARRIAGQFGSSISIVDGNLQEGLDAARDASEHGARVVVSRGGTALLITQASDVCVPVVNIPFISNELVRALRRAVRVSRCVGVVRFANTLPPDIATLSDILDARIVDMPISCESQAAECIADAVEDGIGVIVGGVCGVTHAAAAGLPGVLIESCEDSLHLAFSEAINVAGKTRVLQRRIALLRQAIDAASDGIIVVDQDGQAVELNRAAEQLTGVSRRDAVGRHVCRRSASLAAREGTSSSDMPIALGSGAVSYSAIVDGEEMGAVVVVPRAKEVNSRPVDGRKGQSTWSSAARYTFDDVMGCSRALQTAIDTAKSYASCDYSVLLTGETGTGKELFAQSIHNASARRQGPFVTVNCAALPETLLESELFGYAEGAFTGARRGGKAGLFEQANGGTVFLDEIAAMPLSVQQRFLRVLEDRRIMRVGDDRIVSLDVRVVAATNREISALVDDGSFLPDLFYRLDVLRLALPPLRDRKEDIPIIAQHLMDTCCAQSGLEPRRFTPVAFAVLSEHEWSGNARELRNVVQRLVVSGRNPTISATEVKHALGAHVGASPVREILRSSVRSHEFDRIARVLEECGGNRTVAAERLGISRVTLWRKLRDHVTPGG